MARNVTPEKQREYNRKSYATKLGLTVEQIEARRQAAREWKERNKARRAGQVYVEAPSKAVQIQRLRCRITHAKKAGKDYSETQAELNKLLKESVKVHKSDLWFEKLKQKHAGKPRLKQSINRPFFLTHSMSEREALRANEILDSTQKMGHNTEQGKVR